MPPKWQQSLDRDWDTYLVDSSEDRGKEDGERQMSEDKTERDHLPYTRAFENLCSEKHEDM